MKKHFLLQVLLLIISLAFTSYAFSVGGQGATCNPSTPNWGRCTLAPVHFADQVTKKVIIPAGHYSSAFLANQANTEYILQGDMTADGQAITVSANYVIINLNGFSVTYNQTLPGKGITSSYNRHHWAVINGSVIQGAAQSGGGENGYDNFPVGTHPGQNTQHNFHASNLYVEFGGQDVTGIYVGGSKSTIEQNTLNDTFQIGTITNRSAGIKSIWIRSGGDVGHGAIVRNNTIIDAKHNGISASEDNTLIYGNHVTLRSLDTNSSALGAGHYSEIYNNTVVGRGVHPLGVYIGWGRVGQKIYNNYFDMETTMLATEYATYPNNSATEGLTATGIRMTPIEGHYNADIWIYDNVFVVNAGPKTAIWAHTGEATNPMMSKGIGLRLGMGTNPPPDPSHIFNNTVTVKTTSNDTTGTMVLDISENNSDRLFIYNNTFTTNIKHIELGGSYSFARGFPLIQGNTLVRVDNFPNYLTFSRGLGGWHDSQVRFVDNHYQGGASPDIADWRPNGSGPNNPVLDVYFGSIVNGEYVYGHRLHDNNGTSSIVIRDDYVPSISMPYAVPGVSVPSKPMPSPELRISVQ